MRDLYNIIVSDIMHNKHKFRIQILLFLFRLCNFFHDSSYKKMLFPLFVFYRFYSELLCCIELRPGTKVGSPLIIDHGFGIVVNQNAVLGDYVHLRHGVTIGVRNARQQDEKVSPQIGHNVSIGCNVSILGEVNVGDGCVIGAHQLVIKDIPCGAVVKGIHAASSI